MVREDVTLRIPNPHQGDISKDLLARLLKQAQILAEKLGNHSKILETQHV